MVCSTLNAWAKRPELPTNCKHPATVTGAPEPGKNCRPAITAHTFDPPSPSLFEKPNWPIYEEGYPRPTTVRIFEEWFSSRLSLSIRSRLLMTPLSLDSTQFPLVVVEYEISALNDTHRWKNNPTHRSTDERNPPHHRRYLRITTALWPIEWVRVREHRRPKETILDRLFGVNVNVWTEDHRWTRLMKHSTKVRWQWLRMTFHLCSSLLVYDYLTKSKWTERNDNGDRCSSLADINPTHSQVKPAANETLRRGMSIALNPNDKPAPPVRRTPSMASHPQQTPNNYMAFQARMNGRLKRPEHIVSQPSILTNDHDFPPPPDFLLASDSQPMSAASSASGTVPSSLFDEIQRGGFKLRKTSIDRDRSAPRIR